MKELIALGIGLTLGYLLAKKDNKINELKQQAEAASCKCNKEQ